jgi:ribonuclease III
MAIVPMLESVSGDHASLVVVDPKTQLQEVSQALGWDLPEYRLAGSSGPDHSKTFVVECWLAGAPAGQGEGPSKKIAEQRAAADALAKLPER